VLDVTVKASSFDEFVDAVLDALPRLNLPVVTGEEGSEPCVRGSWSAAGCGLSVCIPDCQPMLHKILKLVLHFRPTDGQLLAS